MGSSPATSEPTRLSASPRASHRRSRRPDEAFHGRPRQGVQSSLRARPLMEGLGKESDLRLMRGLILRIARGQIIHSP